ncbi:MAG: hypothetical protein ACREHG_07905, partial [Candidatus Saccharimonadales bacterium]
PVERDHYLGVLAKRINVNREALMQKLGKTDVTPVRRRIKSKPVAVARPDEYRKTQDNFLALVLMRPTLRELMDLLSEEMMINEDGKQLFKFLVKNPDFTLGKRGQKLGDYVKIEVLLYEELYQELELNDLYTEASRLRAALVTKFVKTQKEKLAAAQRSTSSDQELRQLLEKDKAYNLLLNKVKGVTAYG